MLHPGSLFCISIQNPVISHALSISVCQGVTGSFRTGMCCSNKKRDGQRLGQGRGDPSFPNSFQRPKMIVSTSLYPEVIEFLQALGNILNSYTAATARVSSAPSINKDASRQTTCVKLSSQLLRLESYSQATSPINRTSNFKLSTSNTRNSTPSATSQCFESK